MRPSENLEKLIKNIEIDTNANMDETVLNDVLEVFGKSKITKSALAQPSIWRIIMKSKMAKLAAAVVTICAAGLFIVLFHNGATPAYAIEQTIEAMRNVTTAHYFGKTFTGEQIEMWVEVNTETGENEKFYLDTPESTILATPNETYMYQKTTNVVTHLKRGGLISNAVRFGRFIEDMVDQTESNSKADLKISEIDGEKPIIMLVVETDELTLECKVDSITKLPMSMHVELKEAPQTGMIGQSIDEIYYNEPLPEGIFDFEIPEGAQVIEQ